MHMSMHNVLDVRVTETSYKDSLFNRIAVALAQAHPFRVIAADVQMIAIILS